MKNLNHEATKFTKKPGVAKLPFLSFVVRIL
jgi:hypothetical protein